MLHLLYKATIHPFQIAYMCSHTRDFCSKPGRELLASISLKHPFIISSVLNRVKNSMDKIGMVSKSTCPLG